MYAAGSTMFPFGKARVAYLDTIFVQRVNDNSGLNMFTTF